LVFGSCAVLKGPEPVAEEVPDQNNSGGDDLCNQIEEGEKLGQQGHYQAVKDKSHTCYGEKFPDGFCMFLTAVEGVMVIQDVVYDCADDCAGARGQDRISVCSMDQGNKCQVMSEGADNSYTGKFYELFNDQFGAQNKFGYLAIDGYKMIVSTVPPVTDYRSAERLPEVYSGTNYADSMLPNRLACLPEVIAREAMALLCN